ncbi:hypothetical protein M758_4G069000 [Ceratodon purpureus]|nr:hypothetical protein M758_4G069000 [Ceratodon purpureus]
MLQNRNMARPWQWCNQRKPGDWTSRPLLRFPPCSLLHLCAKGYSFHCRHQVTWIYQKPCYSRSPSLVQKLARNPNRPQSAGSLRAPHS